MKQRLSSENGENYMLHYYFFLLFYDAFRTTNNNEKKYPTFFTLNLTEERQNWRCRKK